MFANGPNSIQEIKIVSGVWIGAACGGLPIRVVPLSQAHRLEITQRYLRGTLPSRICVIPSFDEEPWSVYLLPENVEIPRLFPVRAVHLPEKDRSSDPPPLFFDDFPPFFFDDFRSPEERDLDNDCSRHDIPLLKPHTKAQHRAGKQQRHCKHFLEPKDRHKCRWKLPSL